MTEGYDVIPNFFISAFVYDDHKYIAQDNIIKHCDGKGFHCTRVSYQFPDRLFDRDTLFMSQYDVNFLYVLYLYARDKSNEKAQWKRQVRYIFSDEIRQVIQKEFKIYAMRARLGVDGALYLQQHFYELNGRVFQPYGEDRAMYYAYARPQKKLVETQEQYDFLRRIGVEKLQGYLFGKPIPVSEFVRESDCSYDVCEDIRYSRYYDEIGKINFLGSTPLREKNMEVFNNVPIAINELEEGKTPRFIYANNAYLNFLSTLGMTSMEDANEKYSTVEIPELA
jgi:hypothetical protein